MKLILVDAYGLLFRAYHALPKLTSQNGFPVGAIHGFITMLLNFPPESSFSAIKKNQHVAIVLEGRKKTFRHTMFPKYKANRTATPDDLVQQIIILPELLSAFGLPMVVVDGFEADDCIASYAVQNSEMDIVIISSDKDFYQLIAENITIFDPIKQITINAPTVYSKFGVYPEQIIDFLSMLGDQADNIPGLKGVGPKTASRLLQQYKSIDNIYTSIEELNVTNKKLYNLFQNNKKELLLYKELITLRKDIKFQLEGCELYWEGMEAHLKGIQEFLKKYELNQLYNKINSLFQQAAIAKLELIQSDQKEATLQQQFSPSQVALQPLEIIATIDNLRKSAINYGWIEIQHENETINVIVIRSYSSECYFTSISEIPDHILDLINNISILKFCSDYLDLMKYFRQNNLNIISSHSFIDIDAISYAISSDKIDKIYIYSLIKRYHNPYCHILNYIKQKEVLFLYRVIDAQVIVMLDNISQKGILINVEHLNSLRNEFQSSIIDLEKEIYSDAGIKFNIGSPKQVSNILFEELKLGDMLSHDNKLKRKTKGKSLSSNAEILEILSAYGIKIAENILKWRHLSKLINTYIDGLLSAISPSTRRIHCTFHATTTNTGRLSTSTPNLQSIPIKTSDGRKLREAIIAPDGNLILSIDYSQIELRLLAHIADIPKLKEAVIAGLDIHSITASQIFGVPISSVHSELRRKAKAINFGIIYGMSAFGLARQLKIPIHQAASYMEQYFNTYSGIKEYMDYTIENARKNGYVTTIMGRKCVIHNINHSNYTLRHMAERSAVNAPIQGSASDIIKMAMIKLPQEIKDCLILQVHDELVFEITENEANKMKSIITDTMVNAIKLSVPLAVEVRIGKEWKY